MIIRLYIPCLKLRLFEPVIEISKCFGQEELIDCYELMDVQV